MKHMLQGWRDFLSRYLHVFRAAWSIRAQLEPPHRTTDERTFLPAHLELTETPVSPTARWSMRIIIACFIVTLLWACFGKIEIVAVAPGKIVVDSRTKVLQPLETAVVRRILVRDGEKVKAHQALIELDATATGAEYAQAEDALLNATLTALRLRALSTALERGQTPQLTHSATIPADRIAAEQALTLSQFNAYQAKRHNLQATIAQRRAELRTAQDTIEPLTESARISKMRSADYAILLKDKYVGRHDYLLREQERITAERDLATQRNRIQEIRSALSAAQEELSVLQADFRQQTLDDLRKADEQIGQLTPQLAKAKQRNRLMTLRSPVEGIVQQLAIHTVGGVVTPAQQLLAVVPVQETLEVEATVLNKDIGFLRPEQRVTVKIESFPYTRYGYLTGKIISISHDAAQDEKLGLVFPVRIRLDNTTLTIDGTQIRMSAGMALSAEIKTGKRTVIDYLLSPLEQYTDEALRER
ncbi:HlyD family type I secretion periplasmic adaptor subunit [Xylella fastidiosa subsp. morus]|uniref:Membrane fusion protein (MFP) family protein n=1 Tax=Xylella fastidiosa subsp. fastidiosa TaxID=644356 RepID=A0AAJ5QZ13_XYLFS|nr:HlyD family type I secretion periplasmic adaptor subunit [Xylella fastidiosa]AIC12676.1 hemolysin [Xylella fastidiosa MUL0034]EWG15236.1 HlyD family type I secretion membrane fusion protein [Xylella fastidiosa Mul-MD]KFA41564.1 HlyD family type I secretion membrane fusion protein [Xylella fastidiosa]KQH73479.1 hemolysin secretion protein D [Xylella fastidiosa]MDD0909458.1 HlyD family type I secretion periplasmic adaptor subunit [Xylella fastidiosa subsp. multiplex]